MADTKIMEKFVRNLLRRTKDISSLSQKSVRDQYLVHIGREELSTSERDILKQMVKRILLEQNGDSSEDEPLSKVVEKGREDAGDGRLKEGVRNLQGRAGKRVRDDGGEKAEDEVPKDVKKRKSSQSDSSPNDSSSERSTKILSPGNHNTDRQKTRNPKRGRSKDVETGSEEENEEYDDINGDRDKKNHPQRPHEGDSEGDACNENDIVSSKESERDSREQSKTRSKHQQKKKRRVGGENMERGRKKCHNIDGSEKGGNETSQELKQPEDVESDSADEEVSQGGSNEKKSEGVEDAFEMQEQCKSESSLESGMDSGAEKKKSGKEDSESDGYEENDGSSRKRQHTQKKGKTNTQTMIQKSGHKKGTKSKGEGNGKEKRGTKEWR
uniref:Uncharacterized protein n=1 Tax=Eptatretus burgeri TaxID=7764 RepID=A0A8C4QZM5_EPTBU